MSDPVGVYLVTFSVQVVVNEAAGENHAMSKVLAATPDGWRVDKLSARFVPDKPEKEADEGL